MQIKVLVVDDEAHIRRGLRMRLAREADISVVGEAETGRAALKLRVVVLSLYDDSRTRAHAQALGVATFLGKHEPVELVVSAVRAAAGR